MVRYIYNMPHFFTVTAIKRAPIRTGHSAYQLWFSRKAMWFIWNYTTVFNFSLWAYILHDVFFFKRNYPKSAYLRKII